MGADAISPLQQINTAEQDATNKLIQSCGTTIEDAQNVVNIVVDESRGNLDNSNQFVVTGSNANMMDIRIESELDFANIDKACVMDTADELYDGLLELDDYFGQKGVDGNDGAQGLPGVNGINGLSILINVVDSTTCLNGGKTFEIGTDGNFDNILSVSEVKTSVDICNGEQGPPGVDGTDGQDGADGADGAQGPAGADGTDGQDGADGTDGQDGADGTNGTDGQDGADGTNGTDGQDGADGTNGTDGQDGSNGMNALVSMTPESAGSNCANGGTRIDVGVDDNSNGVLEATEIDQTQYVCDGGSSNNTMLTSISSPPANMGCDAGGRVVSHGLDNGDGGGTYANGVLETGEIDSSTTFCSRFAIEMLKDINSGSSKQFSLLPHSRWQHPLFRSHRRNQRIRIVEERRNCLRHGDGQGYQQWKWQQFSLLPHSRWQHPLFQSHRRNQRIRIVEERRNCLRHGDGQGYQKRKWQQ